MIEQGVRPALEQALAEPCPMSGAVRRKIRHKLGLSFNLPLGNSARRRLASSMTGAERFSLEGGCGLMFFGTMFAAASASLQGLEWTRPRTLLTSRARAAGIAS